MTAWEKITGSPVTLGRAGAIPVYDNGTWRVFRNSETIWPGVEFAADPGNVEQLRRNVTSLLEAYPDTIPQLEKLGVRVKQLVNRPIKTVEDVVAWADSIFNTGPVIEGVPAHVADALLLVGKSGFNVQVQGGRHPIYVVPAAAPGSGTRATIDFALPGSKTRYGPRHDFTKLAYNGSEQPSVAPQSKTRRSVATRPAASNGAAPRPRGRPRKDGLVPGSTEAKAADEQRKAELAAERASLPKKPRGRKKKMATITELPPPAPPRRRLARVGSPSGESA